MSDMLIQVGYYEYVVFTPKFCFSSKLKKHTLS